MVESSFLHEIISILMLYHHQRQIVNEDPKKTGIFLGTGCGKTSVALLLFQGRTLIVMPKIQFEDGIWRKEWAKLHKEIDRERDMTADTPTREWEDYFESTVTLMTKETFRRDHEKLPWYHTIIFDESHTITGISPATRYRKGRQIPMASQLFEAASLYLNRTKPDRVYLLTATPARSPMAIWGAATLLGRDWDFEAFRRDYYVKLPIPGREIWTPKKTRQAKELLAKTVGGLGYVGRLQDFFDVPDQTHKIVRCPLDPKQENAIRDLPLEYPDPLVLTGKTHQLEQGESKLEAIHDLLLEYPKAVIFARYLDQIARIAFYLKERKIDYLILTGSTDKRGETIAKAENMERCAFIIQSQISTGYNLPSFRCMIFASNDYSFVNLEQARGRNLRADHLDKNLYVYLLSGEVDEAVYECLQNKQDFSEAIYNAKKRGTLSNPV